MIDCKDLGYLTEYLGCKLDREGDCLHATQLALVKLLRDEFQLEDKRKEKF